MLAAPDSTDVAGLYHQHAMGLIRLAMLMVGDAPTAEDVVQDVFLGVAAPLDARIKSAMELGGDVPTDFAW